MSVIRAAGIEQMVVDRFEELQDRQTANWFTFLTCWRWLDLKVDWLFVVYISPLVYTGLILAESCK